MNQDTLEFNIINNKPIIEHKSNKKTIWQLNFDDKFKIIKGNNQPCLLIDNECNAEVTKNLKIGGDLEVNGDCTFINSKYNAFKSNKLSLGVKDVLKVDKVSLNCRCNKQITIKTKKKHFLIENIDYVLFVRVKDDGRKGTPIRFKNFVYLVKKVIDEYNFIINVDVEATNDNDVIHESKIHENFEDSYVYQLHTRKDKIISKEGGTGIILYNYEGVQDQAPLDPKYILFDDKKQKWMFCNDIIIKNGHYNIGLDKAIYLNEKKILNEANRAINAESSLETKILGEIIIARDNEEILETKILNEQNRVTYIEESLEQRIIYEEKTARLEEFSLETRISLEESVEKGEKNIIKNIGSDGKNLFKQKIGVELELKKIFANSNKINIEDDLVNNRINIDINESNINHQNLNGKGIYNHEQIDEHINAKNPHNITKTTIGLDYVANIKNNYSAITNPTKNNDSSEGYSVGSSWFNINSSTEYVCFNNNIGNANWKIITNDIIPGESNTISNIGNGIEIYKEKSGVDLKLKTIDTNDNKLSITENDDTLIFTINENNLIHNNLFGAGSNTHLEIDNHIASINNPHLVTKTQIGLSNVQNIKNNFIAISDPTINDDDILEFKNGSRWINIVDNKEFVCLDNTNGAALWKETTIVGDSNTASNIGENGIGIFKQKSGVDLEFKKLNPVNNKLNITDNTTNNTIDIGINENNINHNNIQNIGIYNHLQIDDHINATNNPHFITKEQIGLGNLTNIKSNLNATHPPGFSDDSNSNYNIGSIWVDIINKKYYICVDNTVASAIWIDVLPSEGITTASNIGNGVGLYYQKTGPNLEFKKLNALSNKIIITNNTNNIDIDINQTNIDHTNISNIGINSHDQIDNHISAKNNPHQVTKEQLGLADAHVFKLNLDALVPPTNLNDANEGYIEGSFWIDIFNNKAYICIDATVNSASWIEITQQNTGEINTASNVGSGIEIFKQKVGTNLEFKKIKANSDKIIITGDSQVNIDLDETKIDHKNLINVGTYDHTEIDTHLNNTNKHRLINDLSILNTDLWSANKIKTELDGKANASHTHTSSDITNFNTQVDSRINLQKGNANGLATLNGSGKVPANQLDIDSVSYKGAWDADINSPTITNGNGNRGDFYVISVSGLTTIDGINDWGLGDWIIFNGITWEKIDYSSQVTSVAGKQGAVTLISTDIIDFDTEVSNNSDVAANSSHRNNTNNPHSVTKEQIGLGNISNIKSKFDASSAPTSNNDFNEGYSKGSIWLDINLDKCYICTHSASGSAVWKEITKDIGENNTASNIGSTGVGIFNKKSDINLEFKKINNVSNKINITDNIVNSNIDFDINESNIIHDNLSGSGINSHIQIDNHIANVSNPHSVTLNQIKPTTTKGDIIVDNGSNIIKLGVGKDNQVLTADSTTLSGIKWDNLYKYDSYGFIASTNLNIYTRVFQFIYPGTNNTRYIESIKIIGYMDMDLTNFCIRVYDYTNKNIIAEKIGLVNTEDEIINMGTISNNSQNEAIYEIQLKAIGSSGDYCYASSALIKYI